MRNCENCYHGSYGLDCNTGSETLYCCEDSYEFEVSPNEVCDSHQFIEGYEDEKHYILFDDTYLGPGFFIIKKRNDQIEAFMKLYIMCDNGYPQYGLRAFSANGTINIAEEFNSIEFKFRSIEDYENGLYEVFEYLSTSVRGKVDTVDKLGQGRNNLAVLLNGDIVRLIISGDIYSVNSSKDYIDINLGNKRTCKYYDAINDLYHLLAQLVPQAIEEEELQKIMQLKLEI